MHFHPCSPWDVCVLCTFRYFPPRILRFISNCVYIVICGILPVSSSGMRIPFQNDWKCVVQTTLCLIFHFSASGFSGSHASTQAEPRSATARSASAVQQPTAACVTGFLGFRFHPDSYSWASSYKTLPEPAPTVHMRFCQLPKMLHKSCRDLDRDKKTDLGLRVLTRNGRLQGSGGLVSLCCWLPLCWHSFHKGWDVARVFCLLFGKLAFTAAGKRLVEPPSHTIQ